MTTRGPYSGRVMAKVTGGFAGLRPGPCSMEVTSAGAGNRSWRLVAGRGASVCLENYGQKDANYGHNGGAPKSEHNHQ